MTYFAAWIILGVCSHILFMDRMNKLTKKFEGFVNWIYLALKDEHYNLSEFTIKKVTSFVLIGLNLFLFLIPLFFVVTSYFINAEKQFEEELEDIQRNGL